MLLATTLTGARKMRPAEPGNKCLSSLIQCLPTEPNTVTGDKGRSFMASSSRTAEHERAGRSGLDRQCMSTAGKTGRLLLCHMKVFSLSPD